MRRATAVVALVMGVGIRAAGAWSSFTNGAFPASSDAAVAIAVDGNGDVAAAGTTEGEAGEVFTVVKHRGTDGAVLWKRLVAGTGDGSGRAVAVAVDGSGAVIAAGGLHGFDTSDDIAVVKWDADGTEVWRHTVDGEAHSFENADALAVDAAGNVVVAASLVQTTSFYDIVVILWNVAGVEQWRGYIDGPITGSFDLAYDVTFDVDGNVVVAGTTGASDDLVVAKWDADGNGQWLRSVRGTDDITVQAVASVRTDSQGNVVVAGALNNATTGFDFTVISWDPSGNERWRRSINGSDVDSGDFASALAIDGEDAVVAVGTTRNEGGSQWTAVKWTQDGAEVWRRVLIGDPELGEATPTDVAIDPAGAVIACGNAYSPMTGYWDLWREVCERGSELWRSILDGGAEDEGVQSEASDGWNAVAVDANGHVLVAGTSIQEVSADDFTVAKLDGATGSSRSAATGSSSRAKTATPAATFPAIAARRGAATSPTGTRARTATAMRARRPTSAAAAAVSRARGAAGWTCRPTRSTSKTSSRSHARRIPAPSEGPPAGSDAGGEPRRRRGCGGDRTTPALTQGALRSRTTATGHCG